jgi:hypothetical protein
MAQVRAAVSDHTLQQLRRFRKRGISVEEVIQCGLKLVELTDTCIDRYEAQHTGQEQRRDTTA